MSAFRRSRPQSAHDLSAAPPRRRLRRPQGGLWDHPDFPLPGQARSAGGGQLEAAGHRLGRQGAGPAIGGGLIQALTAPYAVFADAFTFVASGWFSAAIRKRDEVAAHRETRQPMWTDLKEGLRYVLKHPYLRPQAMCTSTSNFFGSMAFALLLVYAARVWGMSAGLVGVGAMEESSA